MRPANLLLGAVLAVMACSTAHARLGETFDQSVARYGAPASGPESAEADTAAQIYYFVNSGRDIRITFYGDTAAELVFWRRDKKAFSDSEVEKMLSENKSSEWVEVDPKAAGKMWNAWDSNRQAILMPAHDGTPNAVFTALTVEWFKKAYSGSNDLRDAVARALDGAESVIRQLRGLLGY